ncbi:MAG TPA: hypothetical protein VEB19_05965 [Gemmatimonadaceae bacterium]|nr:hypothetical protein [Gemmatimonadaceae bacterium]
MPHAHFPRHLSTQIARSWTGRSALSHATDSALPLLVTAGTFRTRVSGMRGIASGHVRARTFERRGVMR